LAGVWTAFNSPPDSRVHLWHYILIALIPAVLTLLNKNWLFENGAHMDPWYYFGHLQHYPRFHNLIPEYPGERVIWIAAGYLLTHLFGQLPGVIVLHIVVLLAGLFSLHFILLRLIDAPTALLATIAFGCNAYFIGPNGWDFPEGLMFVLLLLSLALAIPARSGKPWLYLTLSGMAWAALLYTYVAWVMLTPAYLFALLRIVRQNDSAWRTALRIAVFTALGGLLTTLCCAALYALMGGHGFFFRRNIDQAFYIGVNIKTSPWVDPEWSKKCTWLIFPVLAFLMSSAAFVSRYRQKAAQSGLLAFYLLSFAAMVFLTFRPVRILAFDYHTSILVPAVFLVFGLLLFRVPATATRWQLLGVTLATAAFSLAPLGSRFLAQHAPPIPVILAAALGLLVAACWNVFRPGRRAIWAVMMALFSGLSFALTPPSTTTAWLYDYKGYDISERVSRALKVIGDRVPQNTYPVFWIDATELRSPLSAEFRAIMCAFFTQARSMWLFPNVDKVYPPGTRIFILTEQQDAVAPASYDLAERQMPVSVLSRDRMSYANTSYWMIQLQVLPATAAIRSGFVAQSSNDSTFLPEGPNAFRKRLTLPESGIYQFELSGLPAGSDLHFGALQRDGETWVDEAGPAIAEGNTSLRWFRLAVSAGEPVDLAIRTSGGAALPKFAANALKLSILRDADPTHSIAEFKRLADRPYGNLLQNGGFENGGADWHWSGGSLRPAANCYHGACAEYGGAGAGQYVTEQRPVEVQAGKQYELSGWIRSGKGSPTYMVGIWDQTTERWIARQTLTAGPAWTPYRLRFSAATSDPVLPRFQNTSDSPSVIGLDETVLVELHGAR
jgi:hypothetical protein